MPIWTCERYNNFVFMYLHFKDSLRATPVKGGEGEYENWAAKISENNNNRCNKKLKYSINKLKCKRVLCLFY